MGYITNDELECKSCGRIIRKNELQYDSPEGRICLECYAGRQPRQTTPLKETRKSPLIAAILNFLLPGIGFIYLGTTPFIIGGFVLLIIGLAETVLTWSYALDPFMIMLSFVFGCFWAFLGFIAANHVNKSLQPPKPVEVIEPLQAKPPTRVVTEEVSRPKKVIPKVEKTIYCMYCGERLPSHAVYCRKCGKKVE